MKNNGYIIKTINYNESADNYNYDPIEHIKTDQDVDVLSDILIGDNDDLFWDDSAKLLVKTIIYYILEKAEKKNLLTLFYLLSDSKESLFSKFDEFEENSKGYKCARILKTFPEKTYESIASTALVKLSFVINKVSDDIDYNKEFDFCELYDKKMIIYVIFNESNRDEQKVANIFISQILSQLNMRENVNEKIYLLLDAIGMLGKINNLGMNILTSRGRNLSFCLITNTLNNLEKIYGDEIYSMLNTVDTQLLLGTNRKSDVEYFSGILGLEEDVVKNLENEKLLIFEKGLKPILADKDYYFYHEV